MNEMNRREWGVTVLGGLAAAATGCAIVHKKPNEAKTPQPKWLDPHIAGVSIGIGSYSFRDRSLDEAIEAMKGLGVGLCELWQGHVEPKELRAPGASREELRRWRLMTPPAEFQAIREKFAAAGVRPYAFSLDLGTDFTDAEMERCVVIAQMLGAGLITLSPRASLVTRFAAFARQHEVRVAVRNQSQVREDAIAKPDDLAKVLADTKATVGFGLDIGELTAAGFDPIDFLQRNQGHTFAIALKDRKRDQGPNVPWGEGDTPVKATLKLLRDQRLAIPAFIEYEYAGQDAADEVRRCLEYCRTALA
jgi:sugar phosphate isomerase/epimerase